MDVERLPWEQFRPWFRRRFSRGEHVFVVGRTGTGKSVLMTELIASKPDWDWVILDAKGGTDPEVGPADFDSTSHWPPPAEHPLPAMLTLPEAWRRWFDRIVKGIEHTEERKPIHVRFAPPKMDDDEPLRLIFDKVLRDLRMRSADNGYSIVFDEGNTIAGMKQDGGLGLYHRVSPLFRTKRFERSSLVIGTQYPSWIPKSAYGETSHQFFLSLNDKERRKRAAEIAGNDEVAALLPTLRKHEFLYHHVDSDRFLISKVKRP